MSVQGKEMVKEKKKNPIMTFISKENFLKVKLLIAAIISVILAVLFEYKIYHIMEPFISKNRIILVACAIMFVFIHFIIKLDVMYEFFYKHRYKIACAFLIFVMIGGYSGSSITNYNYEIQPTIDKGRYHTLLGVARLTRSDEWASSTDYILSQGVGQNKFEYFSNKLRGDTTDMFTLVNAPVLDILMIGKPFQIGFLLFGNNAGLSFYWYVRLVAMFLGAFELCMIVTNKNKKISLLGAIMITFSSAVQWWYCMDCLIWSQIILVLANLFFETKKKWIKYASAFGILVGLLSYTFVLYPPWQVAFAYFMLAMLIWIILKNLKDYKINIHDIIVVVVTLICFGLLVFRWLSMSSDAISATMNTAYPGARCEIGGGAISLYAYTYNIFTAFDECQNACEYATMLSFFPIPMLLSAWYLIRNRKKENAIFIIPMLLISVFLSVWCIRGFPEWLAKTSLLSMSSASRASLALGTMNIYLLIFILGRITKEDKWLNSIIGIILALLTTWFVMHNAIKNFHEENYLGPNKIAFASVLFTILFSLIFNMNKKWCKTAFMYFAIFAALMSGLCVNPIIRSTDIIYDKPVSKMIAKIRDSDPDAIWIGEATNFHVNNYMVANGIRTIGSTSVYPNLKFFEELLGDKAKDEEFNYNRYAHHVIFLDENESHITMQQTDHFIISLCYKDLKKFNIKYILSTRDISTIGYDIELEKLYNEDNMYIFRVK